MEEQIKELTLLLIYLTSWTEKGPYGENIRAWKGYDFDILNKLQDEELIGGTTYKAKSTYITEQGIEKAKELMKKYNIKDNSKK